MNLKVVKFLACFVGSGFIGAGIFLLIVFLKGDQFKWIGWLFIAKIFCLFGIFGIIYWYSSLKKWCRLGPW